MTKSQFHHSRLLVTGIYLALVLAYSVVNPAFESPDESLHFDYIETLLRTQRLPVAETQLSEFHQPPLYYLAGALITAWLPPDQPVASVIKANPFWAWRIGESGADNKSQFVHGPEQAFPYTGLWLRLHLVRLFSALLGLVAIWLIGDLALLAWPDRRDIALLSIVFVAFLPQFLYLASSISNDVATVMIAAAALVAVGRFLDAPRPRRALALGVVLGCGILVKMSLLILCALAGAICIGYLLRRGRAWHSLGVNLAALIGPPLLIAGPYLWRNWLIYGDPTALSRMDAIWGRRQPAMTLASISRDIHNIWTSFWVRFGYGQLPAPNAVYTLCLILTLVALAGLGVAFVGWASRATKRASVPGEPAYFSHPQHWLLLCAILLVGGYFGATLRYAQTSYAGDYGRFVFPALPAIAILLARGWVEVFDHLKVRWLRTGIGVAITVTAGCAFAAWALLGILRPAYVLPTLPPLSAAILDQQSGMRLGDVAILRRLAVDDPVLRPGADVVVEMEWLPLRRTAAPLAVTARLRGPAQIAVGERHSYPGLGRTSTTFWEPGRPFVDRYRVPVEAAVAERIAPAEVWLEIDLYDQQTGRSLLVTDWPCGREINPPLLIPLQLPDVDAPPTAPPVGSLARLGDSIELTGVSFPAQVARGAELPMTLDWRMLAPLGCEYKLFIHLISMDDAQPLAQADGFIMGERGSGTIWPKGQRLADRRTLHVPGDLPVGRYRLSLGIYSSQSAGKRLPVHVPGQAAVAENLVIGELEVVE